MAADAEQSAPAEGVAKPRNALVPILAALVVGLVAGGATGAFAVGPALARGIAPAEMPAADSAASDSTEDGDEDAPDGEKKDGEPEAAALLIENIVLNPAGSDGTRFLLISLAFETKSEAVTEELKRRDAELRDVIQGHVGRRTTEELARMETRDALKGELAEAVATALFAQHKDAKLRKKPIKRVYFPQYVIQ